MKLPLKGIVPPLITPLKSRDELDVPGLEKLVEHVLAGGVHGLFLLGSTGEGPCLSYRIRREIIERVCRQVSGRVPVLVGITDSAVVEALHLAEYAQHCGAAAAVASTPFYFPAGQEELIGYFDQLSKNIPLPLMLYNMPACTKTTISVETIRQLVSSPNIIGIKDSSCDMIFFHRLLMDRPVRADWSIMIGPEELLAESVLMGADGGVCGGANLAPRLFVDLYNAALKHDVNRIRTLQTQVLQLGAAIYRVGKHSSSMIKGIKCTLSCLGICDDHMADPASRLNSADRRVIQSRMEASEIKSLLLN